MTGRRRGLHCALLVFVFGALAGCGAGSRPAPPTITSVTVTCGSASVLAGQTVQCTATVLGTGAFNTAVVWHASAGSISNSGLFTAPGTAGQVTISATAVGDATKSGSATVSVTVPPTITGVTISCPQTSIVQGTTEQCTATVQGMGAFDSTVTWHASGGTISNTGLFTAPSAPGNVTITATANGDTSKSASTTVTVLPSIIDVTLSCPQSSLPTGQSEQCTATVQGNGTFDQRVTWQASAGTISSSGLFTAPGTAGNVTITAKSVGDPTKSASVQITVTVVSAITGVTLTCPEASLGQGMLEQCKATVQGTGTFINTVTWQASAGTVSAVGLFTAPNAPGDVMITATAVGDSSKSATKTVTVAAPQSAGFDYQGISHVSWWHGEYSTSTASESETALAATGANWAGVLVTEYMPTRTSTTIGPTDNTPTDADVISAIQHLHNAGVRVMLKPHVDVSDGSWRGDIAPTDVDAWFANFATFITHYAQMAQDNGVEMLCFGTEYKTMTGVDNLPRWTSIISAIRAVYTGKLAYAANATSAGDEFTSVSFWDQVDVIGLDGYFPLTNHADPTISELLAAWNSNRYGLNIVALVTNFANAHPNQPVIFTEIGYRSAAGANMAPWDYQQTSAADTLEQQNCYHAMYQTWGKPGSAIKGQFWWAWPVNPPGANDTDYNPRNKPAQIVFQNWQ